MFNLFRSQKQTVRYMLSGILFVTALSMVVYLIPGLLSTPTVAGEEVLVEIGDQTVTPADVAYRLRQFNVLDQLPGDSLALMVRQTLDQVIQSKVLLEEANRLGMMPSDQELTALLKRQLPHLFVDGVFVGGEQYRQMVSQTFQLSIPEFEKRLREDFAVGTRLRRLAIDNIIVSEQEIENVYRLNNSQTKVEFVKVEAAPLMSTISASEEELQTYFTSNLARYRVPEKRSVKIMTIDDSSLPPVEVTPAEVEVYYRQNREQFEMPERIKVSHILLATTGKNEEELKQIRAKIEDLQKQAAGGADFADLARKNTEDPGTLEAGGDLGFIGRGEMVPAFDQAAFNLQPGQVSGVVETEFGFHVIKMFERESARVQPLDDVRETIREGLEQEKLYALRMQRSDKAGEVARRHGKNLEAAGKELSAQVMTFERLNRGELSALVENNNELLNAIFLALDGEVVTTSTDNKTTAAVVTEIVPETDPELSAVRDRVLADYRTAKSRELAAARAGEIAAAAREAGGDLAAAAAKFGLKVQTSEYVKRSGTIPELGGAGTLGERAWSGEPGTIVGPVQASGGSAVARVVAKLEADMTEFPSQRKDIYDKLLNDRQQEMFDIYSAAIQKRYEESGQIKRNQARIEDYVRMMRARSRG